MKINSSYPVIMCEKPQDVADFYITHFDFEATFSSDWYISLSNMKGDTDFELAVLDYKHPTVPHNYREKSKGVIINLEVDDVDDVYKKVVKEILPIMEIKSEDFGQRHFIVADPAGLLVDVIQVIPPSKEFEAMYQQEEGK